MYLLMSPMQDLLVNRHTFLGVLGVCVRVNQIHFQSSCKPLFELALIIVDLCEFIFYCFFTYQVKY